MVDDSWFGLYGEGWQNEIVPEAMIHPAKYSRALIRHIYDHAILEGWLQAGCRVLDPFGGVALGALDAMRLGLDWTGIELESHFLTLGNQNIELWLRRYAPHFPGWGTARLIRGDSRELLQVIGQAEAMVSSPPFGQSLPSGDTSSTFKEKYPDAKTGGDWGQFYGSTAGNLGNLRATEAGFEACLSSPPFSPPGNQPVIGQGARNELAKIGKKPEVNLTTPGQLGSMKANGFDAAVSSPPFGERTAYPDPERNMERQIRLGKGGTLHSSMGESEGQLAQMDSSTNNFWVSARSIVDQVYAALVPGGHAIWVLKAYVKNKKIIDFPGQWQAMCEAAGFTTLHVHRAWLVEDRGTQIDLWGNEHTKIIEKKSFFRRLAEKHGSPRIDFETALCTIKPAEK
mgnify:CR=1 FL=1